MAFIETPHSDKSLWSGFVAGLQRFANASAFVIAGQALLVFAQLALLTIIIDWLVTSLLNLPLIVTIFAVLLVSIPAFYIFWKMLKLLEKLDKSKNS